MLSAIVGFVILAKEAVKVTVNGSPVVFEQMQPRVIKGHLLVPMRGVFDKLGAHLHYNPVTHIVSATKDNEVIEVKVGDLRARRNGIEITMDAPPASIKGNTLVPLRFIAEAFGANVSFDAATNTVSVTTGSEPEVGAKG